MKKLKKSYLRFVWLAPLIVFLIYSFAAAKLGWKDPWQEACIGFWNNQQWPEITAFGENLWDSGEADPKTLCFAMLASEQLHQKTAVDVFAQRLLLQKMLNLRIELETARRYRPESLRERIALYRTRTILGLFACIALFNLISLWQRRSFLPWIGGLSLAGLAIIIV